MPDRIKVSPNEVALGADVNTIQQYISNFFGQLMIGMLTGTVEGIDRSAVMGGFAVSIAAPYSSYVVSPGVAFQTTPTLLETGDFPVELMSMNVSASLAATAPGVTGRTDIVEMRVQARSVTNADRPFYQPGLGNVSTQTTPKNVRSVPQFRVRTNVSGSSTFSLDWIPLALVQVYNDLSGNPVFNVIDCRPLFRQRNQQDADGQVYGELSTPGSNADDYDNALVCGGSVMFDGRMWPLPAQGTRFLNLMEYGVVLSASPTRQYFHLYIAKPDPTSRYSPDYVQYILSPTPPNRDGTPSVDLQMYGPCSGVLTSKAAHIESLVLIPAADGLGVIQPHVLTFRRSGNKTLIGSLDAIYEGTLSCAPGVPRVDLVLTGVPFNASFVTLALFTIADSGFTSVTKIGFATNVSGLAPYTPFQKFSTVPTHPAPSIVDAPIVRSTPGTPPRVTIVGDNDFRIHYQILGWSYSPNAIVSTQG